MGIQKSMQQYSKIINGYFTYLGEIEKKLIENVEKTNLIIERLKEIKLEVTQVYTDIKIYDNIVIKFNELTDK